MASGDQGSVQSQLTNQGSTEQNSQNALQNMLYGQNLGMQNNYNTGTGTDFGTYNNVNQGYSNFFNALSSGQAGVGIGSTLPQQGGQQQGSSPSFNNMGGGWNQASAGTPQGALAQAFSQGLSGQQAVDAANSSLGLQPPNSISANSDGSYGLPNGFYVAPNAQNGGSLDLIQRSGGGSSGGGLNGALSGALGGFQNFAQTGGYSPQALQSIRDQAVAANQASYKTAQSNLNQNRAIQQFSPNYAAASTNLARNMGYTNSNAMNQSNAAIAQMVNSGQLAGLSGMTNIGNLNNQAQGMNLNAMLGALGGNTSLYGAAPGMGSTYGNQLNQSGSNMLGSQGMQNQIGGQQIQGQIGLAGVPTGLQATMGDIGSVLGPVSGLLSPFGNLFGGGSSGTSLSGTGNGMLGSTNYGGLPTYPVGPFG